MMRSKLPVLPQRYTTLYEAIIAFQNAFMKPHQLSPEETLLAKSTLSELILAVNAQAPYALDADNVARLRAMNPGVYGILANLTWTAMTHAESVAPRTRTNQITLLVAISFLFYELTNWQQGIWIMMSTGGSRQARSAPS